MKNIFSHTLKLIRYSGVYYLLIAGLLFVMVDRKGMFETRRLYMADIVASRGFEEDRDNLVYFEYEAIKDPSDYVALAKLGCGYFNLGDYRQAEKYFRKALRLEPESREVQQVLDMALAGKRGEKPALPRIFITRRTE